ncbi:MAG TPA: TetR/AcrR family transcriptional regulator [Baekduia sp.]|uniref:TetR/AcrR family transcriptional regulator n=1 Tax=Baekduia sp. TaxID=2600305 RepID=UPI002D774957|nr:TetR/AcrR family transcriptional regulator [Baekduia sp.]HET6506775.1 TetR/AcrR family transcriptional regulator [Baekduia sp.]
MTDLSLVASHPEVSGHLAARGSQRARLVEGMIQAVAEKGYAAATVADAVRAARVSRGTFYAQFASKEECFLEAYKYGIDVIVERIRAAIRAEDGDWIARLRTGLRAYLETLAGEPRFARTHLFEVHMAGPRAGAARDAALRAFADRYKSSFRAALKERPELRMPTDDALFILSAGVDQLVCARVRAGHLDLLPDLTDELTRTAVAFLEGAAAITPPTHEGGS